MQIKKIGKPEIVFRQNCESVSVCFFGTFINTWGRKKAFLWWEVHKKMSIYMGIIYIYIFFSPCRLKLCEIYVSVCCTRATAVGSLSFRPCKQALHCGYNVVKMQENNNKKSRKKTHGKTLTNTPQSGFFCTTVSDGAL